MAEPRVMHLLKKPQFSNCHAIHGLERGYSCPPGCGCVERVQKVGDEGVPTGMSAPRRRELPVKNFQVNEQK
jgi:hypothetical protein